MSELISGPLGIIGCPGGEHFAREVLTRLKKIRKDVPEGESADPWVPVTFTRFANGEFKAEICRSIRGTDLFIVQDVENHYPLAFNGNGTTYPLSVNDHVMILFSTVDAAIQAGAKQVTLVIPSYPFSRQHKKRGREALTASWFGKTMEHMGVRRIITLDIHSKEIENSFNRLRLDDLHASYQIIRRLTTVVDLKDPDLVVVSPDTGAVDRNKFYAANLSMPLALIYKERDYTKVSHNANDSNITDLKLLGSVEGKTVFMADDILGTGGTLITGMKFLKDLGAKQTVIAASLPLFTGRAIDDFDEAFSAGLFDKIIGTNAVYHDKTLLDKSWYLSADVSNLFARIIYRMHRNESVSALLDNVSIIQRLLSQQDD